MKIKNVSLSHLKSFKLLNNINTVNQLLIIHTVHTNFKPRLSFSGDSRHHIYNGRKKSFRQVN